ncbi:MAG: glutamate 5-kinase [Woeseiaceae bacterium]|nr:glutamate 5-kinase [Woeseiaceae bacterium]
MPVINENDTVATDELRYGDNDRLAARVAQLVMADGLVLLSDVDGLYTSDPRTDRDARHIPQLDDVDDAVMAMASGTGRRHGSGGMRTKLQAARIATHAGCSTWIMDGTVRRPLTALAAGARCTLVSAARTPAAARKQWLAGILEVRGRLHLDAGASAALRNGNSLLAVGIAAVGGDFVRGDAVMLVADDGAELGRGLVAYGSGDVEAIRGCRSAEIEARLGYHGRAVVVHRDDLVLFDERRR